MTEYSINKFPGSDNRILLTGCDHRLPIPNQANKYSCQHPNVYSLHNMVTGEICDACNYQRQKNQSERIRSKTIHVSVTTFNRAQMLKEVLDDIYQTGIKFNLSVDVFDDGSSDDLSFLANYPMLRHFRRGENGGVKAYWYLIQFAFKQLISVDADYYFFLPDDVRLVSEFFFRTIDIYESINDPQKIALNLLMDKSREGIPCWTRFQPQKKRYGEHEVWLTQWTDLCFMAQRKFFELVDFNIKPVSETRWHTDPNRSTGVGEQLSHKLVSAEKHLYHVTDSLVRHGNHSSRFFPEFRQRQPLIAVPNEQVIAGLATIPSREITLSQMIRSILPQVDQLHVYLNGFNKVPDFLEDPKIICYLSQDYLGDLGDAGKYFTVEKHSGYYFSLDDDICYPPDYVAALIEKIEKYDRKAVVGIHGIKVTPPIQSYYRNRKVFHCRGNLDQDHPVHILGTGALAFHKQTIDLSIENFSQPNMADIWFGIAAQQQKIPLFVVSHQSDWLEVFPVPNTIYDQYHEDDGIQTKLINSVPEWKLWSQPVQTQNAPTIKQAVESVIPDFSNLGNYATHLPLLYFLVKEFAPQFVLEFGMGLHSTPLLVKSGAVVVSLETKTSWWEQTKTNHPRHQSILWPNEEVQDYLLKDNESQFDLAFVDGPVDSRVPCVQRLFDRARLIVIHDSFTRCYNWEQLEIPQGYQRFDYRKFSPDTSVFANNPEDWQKIERFCQAENSKVVKT